MHVLVVAKAPVAGQVKTRLCPPCAPEEAALLAEAALCDTLEAAVGVGADRCVLALAGRPGPWLPAGVEVIAQRGDGLAERLAAAWADAGGPGVQVGMDTPQVTGTVLAQALDALDSADAALGLAEDGGWWAMGLRRPSPLVFRGIAMSAPTTGAAQRRRLGQLGFRVADLPVLRDVDDFADAVAVAEAAPDTRFARQLDALGVGARS